MKVTTILVSAMLLFGLTGVAHATNMVAGPLSSDLALGCVCAITNVSTIARTIEIHALDKGGNSVTILGPKPLAPGAADGNSTGVTSLQSCKFINASPTYFRASMSCTTSAGESFALPAR